MKLPDGVGKKSSACRAPFFPRLAMTSRAYCQIEPASSPNRNIDQPWADACVEALPAVSKMLRIDDIMAGAASTSIGASLKWRFCDTKAGGEVIAAKIASILMLRRRFSATYAAAVKRKRAALIFLDEISVRIRRNLSFASTDDDASYIAEAIMPAIARYLSIKSGNKSRRERCRIEVKSAEASEIGQPSMRARVDATTQHKAILYAAPGWPASSCKQERANRSPCRNHQHDASAGTSRLKQVARRNFISATPNQEISRAGPRHQ